MRWLKRDLWKAGIVITSMPLLLVLMVWVPVSAAGTHERASEFARPGTVTVQVTPTEDATVTALNKEKLAQEVKQLKNQNEPDALGWLRTNSAILLSTLVVVIGGLIGLFRWFGDRRSERDKRAEERFQAAVTGLGDEKEGAKIGAAILLRTFLRPGYEQFYTQTFDLAVANLCLPRTAHLLEDPDGLSHKPEDPNTPHPPTPLSHALIAVFKEAYPLAREWIKKRQTLESSFLQRNKAHLQSKRVEERYPLQSLDATGIQLDNADLNTADLKQAFMPRASLRKAQLILANLSEANLAGANLSHTFLFDGAKLIGADLTKADLGGARLVGADLTRARLNNTKLIRTELSYANFEAQPLSEDFFIRAYFRADLSGALSGPMETTHSGADLSGADLSGATLRGAELDRANLEDARFLEKTNLQGVTGLTKEQLAICKAKGAITEEDSTTSVSQSIVSPPPPLQDNDAQVPSPPPTQESLTPPDTGDSSAACG